MTDTITVYDTSESYVDTVSSDTIDIEILSTGAAQFTNGSGTFSVGYLDAELDSDELNVELTGSSLTMNQIRATGNGSGVTSRLGWEYHPTSGSVDKLIFETPENTDEEVTWTSGDGVPVVKLKVKIRRR